MMAFQAWLADSKRPLRLNKNAYAKSLMITDWQQLERRIMGLLWLMLIITTCCVARQGWFTFFNAPVPDNHAAPRWVDAKPFVTPVEPSPIGEQKYRLQEEPSVFALHAPAKAEQPSVATPSQSESAQSPSPSPRQNIPPRWVMQVQRGPLPTLSSISLLAQARTALQQEKLQSAQPLYAQLLAQDPHQLEALVGMLYISQRLGDQAQYEQYSLCVRQLMPGIEANAALFAQLLEQE
ncbi:hypothetical protein [Methylophilus sp. YYY-1]|uniref:tetratricopeptide repeat protein n=1 Tax=Methylophilus sp. YYY-1 TaxID=2682087 RepID=UPI0023B31450|nr:hypothetical protein [Methylophilus sp. YYY-1]MDF0379358.1 hypothetical protein [Methylophilus sp. YYY-1]